MPEVQPDFGKLLEAATAVGEAHMEPEKAKRPRFKTKQNKTVFRNLPPWNFRFLLMPWLLCESFLFANCICGTYFILSVCFDDSEVTWRAAGWLSLCTDKSCCVLGVLGNGVLDSAVSFVGVAARKVLVRSHMLEIRPVWNENYSKTQLEMSYVPAKFQWESRLFLLTSMIAKLNW